ncbi:MAG: DUF3833 family protein [Sphingomicrobium sp.]
MNALIAAALVVAAGPAEAPFDPISFFRGRTHGEGIVKIIFTGTKQVSVDSLGHDEKDGSLLLRQHIHEGTKPVRVRYWRLRQTTPGHFAGTLSDAAGPVEVDLVGNAVHIRYTDKDHLNIDQWLRPSGPTTLRNRMRVKRFGIVVAHVDEVIRKLD